MPRSKTWLTKGGFTREDSDDELGYDDHPWQWIHDGGAAAAAAAATATTTRDGTKSETDNGTQTPTRSLKRKANAMSSDDNDNDKTPTASHRNTTTALSSSSSLRKRHIVGAKMGAFSVRVGDAVLLKSPEAGKDWAGLVCAFSEVDEDGEAEMCAHIMWFCSHEELESTAGGTSGGDGAKTRKTVKRNLPPALSNESYITADFNMNPLTAINGKANVLSLDEFQRLYPGGKMPKGKAAAMKFSKTIICRRGVSQRNLRFTDDFDWRQVYKGPEDLLGLLDLIKEQTRRRRPKQEDTEYDASKQVDMTVNDVTDENLPPTTPKKQRKTTDSAKSTPKSSVKSTKFITPSGRRIKVQKPLEITPLGTRILSPFKLNGLATSTTTTTTTATPAESPYATARTHLHVSAVPSSLPCRDAEFDTVYTHLHSAITDGSGACIYISGTPGTGKTATVREVVSSLLGAVQSDELDDFNFVEINGMKVTEPAQSYSLLWEALKGQRVSPANALGLLEHEFSHPNPRRIPCVVLMDELDQLVTKSQSVMYNFFNWPGLRHSRLIVLAVANTMDLPERTLSNKISSRMGLTRIAFPGYSHQQLMEIISSRLEGARGVVDPDAVQFAARKVAAVSGDARRALDICRRAVEIAEQQAREHNQREERDDAAQEGDQAITPSKTGRGSKVTKKDTNKTNDKDGEEIKAGKDSKNKRQPRVTIATIKQAINEATSSPIAQHLRSLPLPAKLFLAALLARSRRTGVSESTLGDVLVEAKRIADVAENSAIHDFLLVDRSSGSGSGSSSLGDKHARGKDMPRVLGMGAAAMELVEAGIIAMDVRGKGERAGKVRLRVGEEEVKASLMGDLEVAGMGFNT